MTFSWSLTPVHTNHSIQVCPSHVRSEEISIIFNWSRTEFHSSDRRERRIPFNCIWRDPDGDCRRHKGYEASRIEFIKLKTSLSRFWFSKPFFSHGYMPRRLALVLICRPLRSYQNGKPEKDYLRIQCLGKCGTVSRSRTFNPTNIRRGCGSSTEWVSDVSTD